MWWGGHGRGRGLITRLLSWIFEPPLSFRVSVDMLIHWQPLERTQAPLRDHQTRERVAEGSQGIYDFWSEVEQVQQLGDTGARHTEPACEVSSGPVLAFI